MKYKTICRICLRLMGVYFAVQGCAELAKGSAYAVNDVLMNMTGSLTYQFVWAVSQFGGGLMETALGLYLFFGGKWVVNRIIPSNRPYCHECGYDLTGARFQRCPECGTPFASRAHGATTSGDAVGSSPLGGSPLRGENVGSTAIHGENVGSSPLCGECSSRSDEPPISSRSDDPPKSSRSDELPSDELPRVSKRTNR